MTANELRAMKAEQITRDSYVGQIAWMSTEIAAQLATLNQTLERLARAVEQAVPPAVKFSRPDECSECGSFGHDAQDCPDRSR